MIVRWLDLTLEVHVRRRWFPWPTDNVTFGRTIFAKSRRLNGATIRHEATHCRQYHERGWWWVWTHKQEREAEARASETSAYPTWETTV